MLDQKTAAVTAYLVHLAEDGGYKVIDADDIAAALPTERIDRETLRQIVFFLQQREYISVKYAADDEYCFTSLPKGRAFLESREEAQATERLSQARAALPVKGQGERSPSVQSSVQSATDSSARKPSRFHFFSRLSTPFWAAACGSAVGSALVAALSGLFRLLFHAKG